MRHDKHASLLITVNVVGPKRHLLCGVHALPLCRVLQPSWGLLEFFQDGGTNSGAVKREGEKESACRRVRTDEDESGTVSVGD